MTHFDRKARWFWLALLAISLQGTPRIGAQGQEITRQYALLGTLGGNYSAAYDARPLIGVARNANGQDRAVFWKTGSPLPMDLGTLGGMKSYAYGVNYLTSPSVVGKAQDVRGNFHATLWENVGTLKQRIINLDAGDKSSVAQAVNSNINNAQIVGSFLDSHGNWRAALWEQEGGASVRKTPLGTLGGESSHAYGLNELGEIAGSAQDEEGHTHAVLWHLGADTGKYVALDLGTPGGDDSEARAINEGGDVAGSAKLLNGAWHAVLWHQAGGADQQTFDLGTLGGKNSHGFAISSNSCVVGSSETTAVDTQAFFYQYGSKGPPGRVSGQMIALTTGVPDPMQQLLVAYGISRDGDTAVGLSFSDRQFRAFSVSVPGDQGGQVRGIGTVSSSATATTSDADTATSVVRTSASVLPPITIKVTSEPNGLLPVPCPFSFSVSNCAVATIEGHPFGSAHGSCVFSEEVPTASSFKQFKLITRPVKIETVVNISVSDGTRPWTFTYHIRPR